MVHGPNPPTAAAMAQFDAEWRDGKGRPVAHRNVCVQIKDGRATILVNGMPDYVFYYTPEHEYVTGSEVQGSITIEMPDDPHGSGTACLGIASH